MKIKDFSSLEGLKKQIGKRKIKIIEMSIGQHQKLSECFPPNARPVSTFNGIEIKVI